MGQKSTDILITISGDDKGFSAAVTRGGKSIRALGNEVDKTSRKTESFGKSLLKYFSWAAVIMGFKKMITATGEAQKAEQQLEAVLKSTGYAAGVTADEMKKLASSLQDVTLFEDDAILGAENLLLTFTKIGKNVIPQATESVLDISQALGQDLKSSSIQVGKALNDPITGITALRRVGVSFTGDQEKLIETLVRTGDMAGAQAVILKELQKEFGGSARAATGGMGGAMTQAANALSNVLEIAGTAASPALINLANSFKIAASEGGVLAKIAALIGKAIGKVANTIAMYMSMFDSLSKAGEIKQDAVKSIIIRKQLQSTIDTEKKLIKAYGRGSEEHNSYLAAIKDRRDKYLGQLEDTNENISKTSYEMEKSVKAAEDAYNGLIGETKALEKENKKVPLHKPLVTDTGVGGDSKKADLEAFNSYIGKEKEAELLANEKKYNDLMVMFRNNKNAEVALTTEYAKKKADIEKEYNVKAIENVLSQTEQVVGAFGELSSVVQMAYQNQIAGIDITLKKALEAVDLEEQRRLEMLGIVEETELTKKENELAQLELSLAAQTDSRKRAALQQTFNEKQKEVESLRIKDQADKKRALLEAGAEKKKRKLIRDTAIMQKAAMIVETIQNTAVAVMKAYAQTGIFGGPWAATFIGGLGAAKVGLIAEQPLPEAAQGAFIPGSRDGTLIRVAERNRAEAIMPLENQTAMSNIGESIVSAMGKVSPISNDMRPLNVYIGNEVVYSGMFAKSKTGEILIDQRAIVSR